MTRRHFWRSGKSLSPVILPANIAVLPRSRSHILTSSSTAEGKALIDQIAEMHVPIFVFTGGDPLKRPDLYELIRYSRRRASKLRSRRARRRC